VLWADSAIGIRWPVEEPLLSAKDQRLPLLNDIPSERLPAF
jgi:dTDP-4-dehydrorhamnose 3,5-epimerase